MKLRKSAIAVCMAVCGLASCAKADLIFNLNPAGLSGFPGDSLTFNATLTNTGTDKLYLNGLSSFVYGDGLYLDDALFWSNFPVYLDSSQEWTADILGVQIDHYALPDDYLGTITIFGGYDEFSNDELTSQNFLVSVNAVPEPSVIGLLGLGLVSLLKRRPAR